MTENAEQWFTGYHAGISGQSFWAKTPVEMRGYEAGQNRMMEMLDLFEDRLENEEDDGTF
jgi:hypothetical protein